MEKARKPIPIYQAVIPFLAVIILGLLSVLKWKIGMNIPIIFGILVAAIIGLINGKKWNEMQKGLVDGVSRALPALFIMIIIGAIMGSWLQGGIISTLIYYGLKIISPEFFIPAACLVTAIVAVSTGTSFTSIATVGLALMVTGLGMGFSAPVLAGAIISGAYFGDCLSPLSDTPNLASAVTGTNLFDLIRHLAKTQIPALLISLIVFFFLGRNEAVNNMADLETIKGITNGLKDSFVISPFLLIVPMLTIVFSIKKVPAIPSLVFIAILGALCALFVQKAEIGSVLGTMTSGFVSETGNEMVDNLLTRGGINSMGGTIILLTSAVGLGGILEEIGALDAILNVILKGVKSDGSLVLVTVFSGLFVAFATGAQLLAIVIPARMYQSAFKERNLSNVNLGRISQSIGAIAINIVPWSVPALFAEKILGVPAIEFIPYVIFAFATIVVNIVYGYTGFTMEKKNKEYINERN
ncbi:Na+/H+ antiporter NhaC [Miniphocaeibacter massiliensis]|uniref:Na+/H+ antiporter NhaC n=1 Tax=Miniphocaeibacter massiliensis TaxID=2041841 RepID=UPI000C1C5E02|nr:Na+/H+ antiporter NhaC [Miniphocaeibacter massiliensis]